MFYNNHQIKFEDISAENYCFEINNFLKIDIKVEDRVTIDCIFSISITTASAMMTDLDLTIIINLSVISAAISAVVSSTDANDNDVSSVKEDQHISDYVINLKHLNNSDSEEKNESLIIVIKKKTVKIILYKEEIESSEAECTLDIMFSEEDKKKFLIIVKNSLI